MSWTRELFTEEEILIGLRGTTVCPCRMSSSEMVRMGSHITRTYDYQQTSMLEDDGKSEGVYLK